MGNRTLSNKLRVAFEEILKMPYFENERARSGKTINGHEDAIAIRFEEAGLTKLQNEDYPRLKKNVIKDWAKTKFDSDFIKNISNTKWKTKTNITFNDMPLGSFIEQPAGSQSFPDFLVRDFNGRFIAVEAKSGRNGVHPMWNDNLPHPGAIYILSSGKLNETTLFNGSDVISDEMVSLREQLTEKLKEVMEWGRTQSIDLDEFNRGWDLKFRTQNFQGRGKDKTNYFTHPDRKKCEENVLEFVSQ